MPIPSIRSTISNSTRTNSGQCNSTLFSSSLPSALINTFAFLCFMLITVPTQARQADPGSTGADRSASTRPQTQSSQLTLESIFLEPILPGVRPSFRGFTAGADSMMIAWNDSAHTETGLYRVSLSDPRPVGVADTLGRDVLRPVHAPDMSQIAWIREAGEQHKLVLSRIDGTNRRTVLSSRAGIGSLTWSHDSSKIAFTREGDAWVYDLTEGSLHQVTRRSAGEPSFTIEDWAGNRYLILRQTDFSGARTVYFPEYVDDFVIPGESRRGIPEVTLLVAHLDSPRMDTLATGVHRSSATGSATGSFVAMDYADAALKEREIVVFHPESGARMTLFEDRTEGWLYDYDMEFAPDGDLLLFRSEQSGWNHLYLADLAGAAPDAESDLGEDGSADGSADGRADGVANGNGAERTALERTAVPVEQLTDGAFEVTWFAWSGEREFVYATNEADYGEVHLFHGVMGERSAGANSRAEDATATVTHTPLTSEEGYRYQFQLTPDKRSVVYAKTYFNQPYDLYRLDITADSRTTNEEIQLTYSVPDSFYNVDWQQEEYVRIPSRDGSTSLAVSVLYPDGYEKQNDAEDISDADDINDAENDTYPVVVFVHGAGSLQNVFKGWSNSYWREYMFHQFLTHQGYIVLEVDYRHSTGYGRKFREDVTNWMGKYETEDIVDGLDWLKEHTNGAADLSRVGIYGGSYGGFMALYAASVEPDRFHAAAALRKVTNWRNYYYANPWYTLPRLGDPDVVPDHYDRSSPLTYVSDIKAPVLLLHGLIDDNVGFQDAMQYTDELIRAGDKDFELMVYPSERHGFTEPTSWLDEYTRIYRFFEKHLNEKHLK